MRSGWLIIAWMHCMGRYGTNAGACQVENRWCCLNGQERNSNYPICAVDPPEPSSTCNGQEDTCPSVFLPLSRILSELQRAPDYSNFVINIGAMDGITGDPLYPALCAQPNISGIYFTLSLWQIMPGFRMQSYSKDLSLPQHYTPSS